MSFYKSLYTMEFPRKAWFSNWNDKSLTLERASWIVRPFSLEEIKEAVFSLPKDKSPGPDGFNMAFVKNVGIQSKRI